MSIVVLKLPEVKTEGGRPNRCPACKGDTFQRWGKENKVVRDPQIRQVVVYRYRCCECKHLFRYYPEGVDQAQQTKRLRRLAALCWVLGLSFRGISGVFEAFGIAISRMTAWRDEQEWAKQLQRRVDNRAGSGHHKGVDVDLDILGPYRQQVGIDTHQRG